MGWAVWNMLLLKPRWRTPSAAAAAGYASVSATQVSPVVLFLLCASGDTKGGL